MYATGAVPGLAYMLVIGNDGGDPAQVCHNTVQVLNPNARFANSSGFISTTVGTVTHGVPGRYQLCFKHTSTDPSGNSTATAGAFFTIL